MCMPMYLGLCNIYRTYRFDISNILNHDYQTFRPISSTIRIPRNQRGVVIGRGGQRTREIQNRTNTRIHFKDELSTEEYHFLSIEGNPSDIKLAEILINQIIDYEPTTDGSQGNYANSKFISSFAYNYYMQALHATLQEL